jgi:transcriptional regulator with XRE-family HTH domain
MRRLNVIGSAIVRLRCERGWTQEVLAARLQCRGVDISRQMLANIESGRTRITDYFVTEFQKVFHVCIIELFPKAVQALDEQFARRKRTCPPKKVRPRR